MTIRRSAGVNSSAAPAVADATMTGNKNKKSSNEPTHVYIKDANSSWIPALQIKAPSNGKATVKVPEFRSEQDILSTMPNWPTTIEGESVVIDLKDYPNQVLPMQNVDANGRLEEYKDMVELPYLHEVRNLDERLRKPKMNEFHECVYKRFKTFSDNKFNVRFYSFP